MDFHIAIDLGSSMGRLFLGNFAGKEPEITEAHRFENTPVFDDGHWRWDWSYLRSEIHAGLHRAADIAGRGRILSVGCSSWSQDFALLDADGRMLGNPICYRDEFTSGLPHAFSGVISPRELVARVGCSAIPITTLSKLKALQDSSPHLLQEARLLLHVADMVHYDLSGEAMTDWSFATAGQLFNIRNQCWDYELLALLDIPKHILPPVSMEPRIIGRMNLDLIPHPKLADVPVISTAHHDTSCATVCFRPLEPGSFFVCLGSYAMPGCVLGSAGWPRGADPEKHALLGIADGQWGLFGSCAGMWIIQECRRIWQARGMDIDYDSLMRLVEDSDYAAVVDLKSPRFMKPTDMVVEIQNACRESGLEEPTSVADISKLVFDSLAAGCVEAVRSLEEAADMSCRKLYLAGGGSRNKYLVKQIERLIGRETVIGPAEATAIGNLVLQNEVLRRFRGHNNT